MALQAAVKPAPVPVKIASSAKTCSQKHDVVKDMDLVQFNMDQRHFISLCHECNTPFGKTVEAPLNKLVK